MALVNLPSLYEHYTSPSIESGLSTTGSAALFLLNERPISLYSGALHYFRVPPDYWRTRLRQLKAAGLNTVETYVPWNLHEPRPDVYDFGDGGSDFEPFLNISRFLRIAREEELFVIVRPGPYICSEWEFGGLPSWLLKHVGTSKLRRNNAEFLGRVAAYFEVLFKILAKFQFTRGGPIIAFQVENEYGNVKVDNEEIDIGYLQKLVGIFKRNDLVELLFTSDTPSNGAQGAIYGLLNTANFQSDAAKELQILNDYQEGKKPLMVMEFWSGWFDHWGEQHHQTPVADFRKELEAILQFPASVNFYMFHGGTTWGFQNGGNIMPDGSVAFDTSSYDYDAPLSEAGEYTAKYKVVQELLAKYNKWPVSLPSKPILPTKVKYDDIPLSSGMTMTLTDLINNMKLPQHSSHTLQTMEFFDQDYGYIIYSKTMDLKPSSVLRITEVVRDTILVLVNGRLRNKIFAKKEDIDGFGYWKAKNSSIQLTSKEEDLKNANVLLVVENFGRVNYGKLHHFDQYRGLTGSVLVNNEEVFDWTIKNLAFSKKQLQELKNFGNSTKVLHMSQPTMYKFDLQIKDDARDTFLDMSDWNKGFVVVNGFILTRYFRLGPQQTCYLPGAFLKNGSNEILVFEHFQQGDGLKFSDKPIFNTML